MAALRTDVLVVGAGPSGCAAAIAVKRSRPDLKVVLVDKSVFPRDKVCGDGIGPGVVSVLEELGITDVVEGETPISLCEVTGPKGTHFVTPLPKVKDRQLTGFVIPRFVFDDRLRMSAINLGVTFLAEHQFTGLLRGNSLAPESTLKFETPHGEVLITSTWVVAADGANSRIRHALGVKRNSDRFTGIAVRSYRNSISRRNDAHTLRFDWIDELLPAYAWYFPGSSDVINFGLGMVSRDRKKRQIDLRKLLERYNSILDPSSTKFSEARDVAAYILPHGAKMPKLAHGNIILIGDAASMINPLSGEGIFYGMAAGEIVGSRIAECKESESCQKALRQAERDIRKRFVAHFRSNYVASVLLRSRIWAAISIRASSRDSRVVADAAELLFGEGRIKMRTALIILARGIRP